MWAANLAACKKHTLQLKTGWYTEVTNISEQKNCQHLAFFKALDSHVFNRLCQCAPRLQNECVLYVPTIGYALCGLMSRFILAHLGHVSTTRWQQNQ